MAYPHKWSPISCKSSAGQRKDTGQRPMLYRWTTQPTKRYINRSITHCSLAHQTCLHNQQYRHSTILPGYRNLCQRTEIGRHHKLHIQIENIQHVHCVSKNVPPLACYNLYIYGSIATIYGVNVARK